MFTCKFFWRASDCIWNLQFSTKREKFSADCWIFGPPSANINWLRGPLECNEGNNTGIRAKPGNTGAGNRGICLLVIGAERGPALLLDWKWHTVILDLAKGILNGGRAGKTKSPALFTVFSKTSRGNQEKRRESITFDPVESRLKLFNCCYYFLYVFIMPHHPESTDIKQKLETAFTPAEGHPNITLLTGGLKTLTAAEIVQLKFNSPEWEQYTDGINSVWNC